MSHICPVCGYDRLEEMAYDGTAPSFEICPSCGTEFGYDDSGRSHEELRSTWVAKGCHWWSTFQSPPPGWDPTDQLARLARSH